MSGSKNESLSRKLLIIAPSLGIGGTERVVCDLSQGMSEQMKWNVRTIIAGGESNTSAIAQWFQEQGVSVEPSDALPVPHAARSLSRVAALRRLVSASKANVSSAHYGSSFIPFKDILALRVGAPGSRCVVTLHHHIPWNSPKDRKRQTTRLAALLAHKVVVHSTAVRAHLQEAGVPASKIVQFSYGLTPPGERVDRRAIRQRLSIPEQAFAVGCLSRLSPHKGIGDLIEAFARFQVANSNLPNATPKFLLIAGEGEKRSALEQLAHHCLPPDSFRFLGRVPDAADVYGASDIFALPSHAEGFGLVFLEAAFHQVPSIGTDVGGIPDAILNNKTGLLVPVGDVAALAAAIERLYQDPILRQRLGEAASTRAYAEFTKAEMVKRYASVFSPKGSGSIRK